MSRTNKRIISCMVLLVVCVLALYLPKIQNDFVWDDHQFIENAKIHHSIENIPSYFNSHQWRLYRPLRSTFYSLSYYFWNLDIIGYHLAGILFTCLLIISFFLVALLLTNNLLAAFCSALIAAWHPVLVGRVAWITATYDIPGLIFLFFSSAAYLRFIDTSKKKFFFASNFLLILGLLYAEEVAVAPLLLILFFIAGKVKKDALKRFGVSVLTAFLLVMVYMVIRAQVVTGFVRTESGLDGDLLERLLTMSTVFWKYILFSVIPIGLAPDIPVKTHETMNAAVLFSVLGIIILVAIAFFCRRKMPFIFIGIGLYFIGFAPYSNIIPLQILFAERYCYFANFGFSFILGTAFVMFVQKTSGSVINKIAFVSFALLLVTYFFISSQRIGLWKNSETLWGDNVAKYPNSYLALVNYADAEYQIGNTNQAISTFKKAIRIKPGKTDAYSYLGNLQFECGDDTGAAENYERAIALDKTDDVALAGLSQINLKMKNLTRAYQLSTRALQANPENELALHVAGTVLAVSGRCNKAKPLLRLLISISDKQNLISAAKYNLAQCLKQE